MGTTYSISTQTMEYEKDVHWISDEYVPLKNIIRGCCKRSADGDGLFHLVVHTSTNGSSVSIDGTGGLANPSLLRMCPALAVWGQIAILWASMPLCYQWHVCLYNKSNDQHLVIKPCSIYKKLLICPHIQLRKMVHIEAKLRLEVTHTSVQYGK